MSTISTAIYRHKLTLNEVNVWQWKKRHSGSHSEPEITSQAKKKYSPSTKYEKKDVVINKHTTIAPKTADFKYEDQEDVTSIQSLVNVAQDQSNLSL